MTAVGAAGRAHSFSAFSAALHNCVVQFGEQPKPHLPCLTTSRDTPLCTHALCE